MRTVFFERLVVEVIVKMGYGGTRLDAGKAIGGDYHPARPAIYYRHGEESRFIDRSGNSACSKKQILVFTAR
jgi:hypothetical protein